MINNFVFFPITECRMSMNSDQEKLNLTKLDLGHLKSSTSKFSILKVMSSNLTSSNVFISLIIDYNFTNLILESLYTYTRLTK